MHKNRRTDPLARFARVSPSARGRMTQQNERLYSPLAEGRAARREARRQGVSSATFCAKPRGGASVIFSQPYRSPLKLELFLPFTDHDLCAASRHGIDAEFID